MKNRGNSIKLDWVIERLEDLTLVNQVIIEENNKKEQSISSFEWEKNFFFVKFG